MTYLLKTFVIETSKFLFHKLIPAAIAAVFMTALILGVLITIGYINSLFNMSIK